MAALCNTMDLNPCGLCVYAVHFCQIANIKRLQLEYLIREDLCMCLKTHLTLLIIYNNIWGMSRHYLQLLPQHLDVHDIKTGA